jgi:hypothetical protein
MHFIYQYIPKKILKEKNTATAGTSRLNVAAEADKVPFKPFAAYYSLTIFLK